MFITPYGLFAIMKVEEETTYYIIEANYDGANWSWFLAAFLNNVGIINYVDFADFGPFYVLSIVNTLGQVYTYYRDTTASTETLCLVAQDAPAFGTACNFRGQLIGGNISSDDAPWDSLTSRSIVWSAIGNAELDPGTNVMAGFSTLLLDSVSSEVPIIKRVMPLGRQVAVYSDSGVLMLSPSVQGPSYTLGQELVQIAGVRSGNHIAGDRLVQGLIDLENKFWVIEAGGKIGEIGYQEFIAPIVEHENETIVSYLEKDRTFYISNGVDCLVINQYGAYKCHQLVSSVLRTPSGMLLGTWDTTDDETAYISTDSMDFGSRGIKSLESVTVDFTADGDYLAYVGADFKYDGRANFVRFRDVLCNPEGEAGLHVAAANFRLRFTLSDYTNAELRYLLANIKYSDQRYKRGTVPGQLEVGR